MFGQRRITKLSLILFFICCLTTYSKQLLGETSPLILPGGKPPGKGKHIVLVSGDEEYRSEEMMPQFAKILATRHGFKCTVLFAIDPATGTLNPNARNNIPGLNALADADLMILFTRFRALPNEQMQEIDAYLCSGRPVLGIRTATHAFKYDKPSKWQHYSDGYNGERTQWQDGFGRLVLGEKWIEHHGSHKQESTRGLLAPGASDHPILRGIRNGDVWGPSDVYGVRLPLPGDSRPLLLGQVAIRRGEYDQSDRFFGMRPDDQPRADDPRNSPMMPIAWTKSYQLPGCKQGQAFASTIGSATDFENEGTRRLLVNAVYWLLHMQEQLPPTGANVDLVGTYEPSAFGFHDDDHWR